MLKDVTLGQYFPGTTVVHRLDPRTKILLVVLYIVALFCAKTWLAYLLVGVCLAAAIAVARIRLSAMLKGLKPLIFIVLLTGLLNLFYGRGEPIAQFWIFKITREGIENAIFMVLRIIMLVMGTSC